MALRHNVYVCIYIYIYTHTHIHMFFSSLYAYNMQKQFDRKNSLLHKKICITNLNIKKICAACFLADNKQVSTTDKD